MSITSFLNKICVQTAVYWGTPISNGFGGYTYDEPIEIKCRWDYKTKLISTNLDNEIVSDAEVLVTQDLVLQGALFLGTFDDLDALGIALETGKSYLYPYQLIDCYTIVALDKVSMPKSLTQFVRTVYLGRTKR